MNLNKEYDEVCQLVDNHPKNIQTNWYLVSGAPSSGKTTSLGLLKNLGYHVNPDLSRQYIEQQIKLGFRAEEVRSNENELQKIIFCLMVRNILTLNPSDLILHDYSLIDNIPFMEIAGLKINDIIWASSKMFKFKDIFLFEPLRLKKDGVRTESSEDQWTLFELFKKTYRQLGYNPIIISRGSVEKRHLILLKYLPQIRCNC